MPNIRSWLKYLGVFSFFWKLYRAPRARRYDMTFRALETAFFLPKDVRNVVVAHHYDLAYSNIFSRIMQFLAFKSLVWQKERVDILIVVSEYWKAYFEQFGFTRIEVVYNAFDIERYRRTPEEVARFRHRYGLEKKPVIYIGNPQKKKGTDAVYEKLVSCDVHLVTSGVKSLDIDTVHLELSHDDYITLLCASDLVVLNSLFCEGWNRVAHEALLCRTPVIGTRNGGMKELLEGAKQKPLEIETLSATVDAVMASREHYAEAGYAFASQFTMARFCHRTKEILCAE
ncbi:glycosyltransferase, family 4 [Hydrogenimonas sp.]|nr:glycosyltransferase, family 4 [Hydrogenimonas sp.]